MITPDPLELAMLAYCDLGAIVRGRLIPSEGLATDPPATVGWTPSAVARPPFGPSVRPNPFGATGDLRLRPDPDTCVRIPADRDWTASEFVLCDLVETDGRSWDCCPRTFLRDALSDLDHALGARVLTSFEHEFQLRLDTPPLPAMSLQAHRSIEPFPSQVMRALHNAGVVPEHFVPESAPHQYEIPVAAAEGLTGADRSVVLREVIREIAHRHGIRVTFTPLLDPDTSGNGVHIHLSLLARDGTPLFYDPDRPAGLSELGGRFAAGILQHAAALTAVTAPSPVSFARLRPGRRSAGAVCLGDRNRETLLRLPPVVTVGHAQPARQVRLEYRAADAAGNPYMALGVIILAGLAGVRERLPQPAILDRDPAQLTDPDQRRYGVDALPGSLDAALEGLAQDATVRGSMSPRLHETYTAIKRAEIAAAAGLDLPGLCRRYADIY